MALGKCWYCNNWLYTNSNGEYEDTDRNSTYCSGSANDLHRPAEASDYIGEMKRYLKRNKKSSASTYCAGCHSKFPSSQGFPHTQSGETLIYCPICSDNGEVLGSENGFEVSARIYHAAPSLNLSCDNCKEEMDPGDDGGDSDFLAEMGDSCPTCNKGVLKFAFNPDLLENANMLQADDVSAMTPDVAEGIQDAEQAPRSFKAPKKMMREQVNGLDKNGDGIYPKSNKHGSYEDTKKHLIQYHNFRNNWLQGYNEKDLLKVSDAVHHHGAYACDHEHPISDYTHQTMVTSSKIAGNIITPPTSFWTGDEEYPKSISLINPNNRHDWSPMSPFKSLNPFKKKSGEFEGIEHEPGEFNSDVWHYKEKGLSDANHGTYEKFYGTMNSRNSDTTSGLQAIGKMNAANVDGNRCKECDEEHGWKWSLHAPVQYPLAGWGEEPLHTYDDNGRKQPIEGHSATKKDAALALDEAHHKEFVQPLKESNIDF